MRTKTLLLTVAIGAVSAATSMAQVYSVNAVGYVNVTCNPGFTLIANPLIQTDPSLNALLPAPPDGTSFYKLLPDGSFDLATYVQDVGWEGSPQGGGAQTIDLGKGGYLLNPTASPLVVTFVGDVAQNSNQGGQVNNSMAPGFTILSSKVPQTGLITTDLNLQPNDGDQLYKFLNPGGLTLYSYQGGLGWEGGPDINGDVDEPTINVGQAFLYNSTALGTVIWTRSFNVN